MTATDEPVKVKGGWAVRNPDGGPRLAEGPTRKACLADLERRQAVIADLKAFEDAKAAREAAWLAERGLSEIDYRDLRPGDTWCTWAFRRVNEVTDVKHLDNGASLIFHSRSRVDELTGDQGLILMVPGEHARAWGILRGRADG